MRFTGWTLSGILVALLFGCLEAIWRLTADQDPGPLGPRE